MDTDFAPVPDWSNWENSGAGVAIADIDGDGRLDVVVLRVDQANDGPNSISYRVGSASDDEVTVGRWTEWTPIPGSFSRRNEGAGIAVADVDGDGRLDLVVFLVDAPDGQNAGYYRVGRAVYATGAVLYFVARAVLEGGGEGAGRDDD